MEKSVAENPSILPINWFDFAFFLLLMLVGWWYLANPHYWSLGYIGESQYGDAQFWWNGALHVAQGLFSDNPGKGFRPGYFLITGLALPVLGMKFSQFYPYLLITFLTAAYIFYLALKEYLGKFIAACSVTTIILNPYTAEWLTTSTTDATGLLLELVALTSLLFAIKKDYNRKWLGLFGFFFSIANLTRPLTTPFIAIVMISLLFFTQKSIKQRLINSFILLIGFSIPFMTWMSIQKIVIDQWSISSNEAGAFYAASDPNIQAWNPDMFERIKKIAQEKYAQEPDLKLMNKVLWQETINNYIKYPNYHLSRIIPNIYHAAKFSPKNTLHGTDFWRNSLFILMTLGLACFTFIQQQKIRALVFLALSFCIYLSPTILFYMILAGACLSLLIIPRNNNKIGMLLLCGYWLSGIISLYLVGGIWGPPLTTEFAINSLGHRLGAQVFFVGDILAAYFLVVLSSKLTQPNVMSAIPWFNQRSPFVGKIMKLYFFLFMFSVYIIYIIGSITVGKKIYMLKHAQIKAFPSIESITKRLPALTKNNLLIGRSLSGGLDVSTLTKINSKDSDLYCVFTGIVSPFIWNLPGQDRAKLMVYAQEQIEPVTMGPGFVILEVPTYLNADDWIGKQGAFLIRKFSNLHTESYLPYYYSAPAIHAFFPLTQDRLNYDKAKVIWFPLVKSAVQLESSKELILFNSRVIWVNDSGTELYQRRFFIGPNSNKPTNIVKMKVDTTKVKNATLSFRYAWDYEIGTATVDLLKPYYNFNIYYYDDIKNANIMITSKRHIFPKPYEHDLLKEVKIKIPENAQYVEISFDNIMAKTGIWIYEFNLSSKKHMG